MARVTVLGLGNMGSALAGAFRAAGHATTGWTRSGTGHAGRGVRGVRPGRRLRARLRRDLRGAGRSRRHRGAGRQDVRAAGDRRPGRRPPDGDLGRGTHGVTYLDGSIATYPARIGDEPTIIFYSGDRAAFDRHRETLAALGGRPTFVGEAVGGAAAADLAWLSFLYGNMIGLFQGAAFLEAEGVDASVVFDAVPSFGIEIAAEAALARDLIARNDFTGDQAALYTHLAGMEGILAAAEQGGINSEFPRLVRDLTARAVAAGHRDHEIAALIEILRRS